MGQKKHPFDLPLSALASAGTNTLEMDPVRPGRVFCIQRAAVENETTAYTALRILKGGRGTEMLVSEQMAPQAARLYWEDDDIYLTEGMYLVCRLTGCQANDVLRAYLMGWWQQDGEANPSGPKTEEERKARHEGRYGTSKLPPRGTGLALETERR